MAMTKSSIFRTSRVSNGSNKRHISEMTQPVGVVAVIERIRIHRDLLPQSGKPAQERAEISRFAGGNGKLLPHSLTAFRLVRKNGFHRGLRALGLLLPAALLLIVVLLDHSVCSSVANTRVSVAQSYEFSRVRRKWR